MPSIFDWLRERLEDDHLEDLHPGTSVAPASDRQKATALLSDLASDHAPARCHGDAPSGNIIASGLKQWMIFDQCAMAGDHAYDVAVVTIRINATLTAPISFMSAISASTSGRDAKDM